MNKQTHEDMRNKVSKYLKKKILVHQISKKCENKVNEYSNKNIIVQQLSRKCKKWRL